MDKFWLISILIPEIYGRLCGQPPVCHCYQSLGLVSCREIETFPKFNRSEVWNVDMLDIKNSSISKLPDLEQWTNLGMLTSLGNAFLDCKDLMQGTYPFYVRSDCPKVSDPRIRPHKEIRWAYLSILPALILVTLGGFKAIYVRRKRQREAETGGIELYRMKTVE